MATEHHDAKREDELSDQIEHLEDAGDEAAREVRSRLSRARTYAREHPGMTVLGAAGLALLAGPEIAVAMLVGAGVATLAGRPARAPRTGGLRARARSLWNRAPAQVRERARAVVAAVRGDHAPSPHEASAREAPPPAHPAT